jgi:diguanylate cyclase (GGDEF)-like protein/putative nucleotidyltransferase with HDIG domain
MTEDRAPQRIEPNADSKPTRVLVLDDEPALRDVVSRTLTMSGCEVVTACNGCEGLQMLLSQQCDVIVSDLMMEPMDGITFLTEALQIRPWLGVVVCSGYIQPHIRQRAAELGISTVLEKPISYTQLVDGVRAEARKTREQLKNPNHSALANMQQQLGLLREVSRAAVESRSLTEALQCLASGFSGLLPTSATGIFSIEDEQALLVISLVETVTPGFLKAMKQAMCSRYEMLSGAIVAMDLKVEVSGPAPAENGTPPPATFLSVPIVVDAKIRGLLMLAPCDGHAGRSAETSVLYHAANHLSTVLIAFHRINDLAIRDELTGLFNRRHLQHELDSVWQIGRRYGFQTGIVIIDIDHFKTVNDTYGHLVGDEVLCELSGLAQRHCRTSDIMARYGGDELVMILPDAAGDALKSMAERLIDTIRNHVFCKGTHNLHCSVSVGAAGSAPEDTDHTDCNTVLARADQALYEAKRSGRDRYAVWSAGMPTLQAPDETPVVVPGVPAAARRGRVVVVDDDRAVLKILELLIESAGYDVEVFDTAAALSRRLESTGPEIDVALVDLNLEDASGLDLLDGVEQSKPDLVKIVITGDATLDNAVESLRHGAYDFIQKPVQREQLTVTLSRALEYRRLRRENRQYQNHLEDMVRQKSRDLSLSLDRMRESFEFTLEAMAAMLDAREQATGKHSLRVQKVTHLMAVKMGIAGVQLETMRQGALLHDIGKIAIPDAILLKPGALTESEWSIMRTHPEVGHRIISRSSDLNDAAELVLSHHEHFDGSGYPRGLSGTAIDIGARVFSVVDAWDAMRSDRPYRTHLSVAAARAELQRGAGFQFDPEIVELFLTNIAEIEEMGAWKKEYAP